jgi:hypothetical protein
VWHTTCFIIIIIQFSDVAFIVSHHHKQDLATIDNNFVENCQIVGNSPKQTASKLCWNVTIIFFPPKCCFLQKITNIFPGKREYTTKFLFVFGSWNFVIIHQKQTN